MVNALRRERAAENPRQYWNEFFPRNRDFVIFIVTDFQKWRGVHRAAAAAAVWRLYSLFQRRKPRAAINPRKFRRAIDWLQRLNEHLRPVNLHDLDCQHFGFLQRPRERGSRSRRSPLQPFARDFNSSHTAHAMTRRDCVCVCRHICEAEANGWSVYFSRKNEHQSFLCANQFSCASLFQPPSCDNAHGRASSLSLFREYTYVSAHISISGLWHSWFLCCCCCWSFFSLTRLVLSRSWITFSWDALCARVTATGSLSTIFSSRSSTCDWISKAHHRRTKNNRFKIPYLFFFFLSLSFLSFI